MTDTLTVTETHLSPLPRQLHSGPKHSSYPFDFELLLTVTEHNGVQARQKPSEKGPRAINKKLSVN